MESKSNIDSPKIGSERSFGVVFSIVFLIFALYPFSSFYKVNIYLLTISLGFFIIAFLAPQYLKLLNRLWFKFGLFLGSIFAPIAMGIIYFLAILPTGLIMRLLKKDLLNLKLSKKRKSYWIEREDPIGSMKNQF